MQFAGVDSSSPPVIYPSPVLGDLGFRANLKAIGPLQPRLGFAFVFPMNRDARDDLDWGIVTSLAFEY
jgi:hypothetical protein